MNNNLKIELVASILFQQLASIEIQLPFVQLFPFLMILSSHLTMTNIKFLRIPFVFLE